PSCCQAATLATRATLTPVMRLTRDLRKRRYFNGAHDRAFSRRKFLIALAARSQGATLIDRQRNPLRGSENAGLWSHLATFVRLSIQHEGVVRRQARRLV